VEDDASTDPVRLEQEPPSMDGLSMGSAERRRRTRFRGTAVETHLDAPDPRYGQPAATRHHAPARLDLR